MENKKQIDFQEIADEMAKILKAKNEAYGNSFDNSLSRLGMITIGVRLDDKVSRIEHLLKNGEWEENNENLLDNLFDNAGYSFLAIRYLVNHGMVPKEQVVNYLERKAEQAQQTE